MSDNDFIPRILIIDDVFGRTHPDGRNADRASLCGKYLFEDVTDDEGDKGTGQKVKEPLARVFFCRGQTPESSVIGDTVENDLEGTLKIVREGWIDWLPEKPRWSMVLLDLCFYTGEVTPESDQRQKGMPEGRDGDVDPDGYFGLRLLEAIHNEFPDLPIVILSSKPKKDVEENYNSMGALGFLAREARDGPNLLRDSIERHGLIPDKTGKILGHSKALLLALRSARNFAKTEGTVLLRGGTGSGKELLAEYIHEHSPRRDKDFLKMSLAAIPDTLAESELFGYEKGAFTGANTSKSGYFQRADGGTLLLDEIGDASPLIQSRLLRAIQNKEVQKVGSNGVRTVDVRVISATNVDVEGMAMTGAGFRRDLYYRIRSTGAVFVPDLKDRVEDIPLLADAFLRQAEQDIQSPIIHRIHPTAMDKLCVCEWPGNVNQLRGVINNAVFHFPDNEILFPHHFQFEAQTVAQTRQSGIAPVRHGQAPRSQTFETSGIQTIEDLIRILTSFDFERLTRSELRARFPAIEAAYAILIANYLKTACKLNLRDSEEVPEGEILIHPAMKMIVGNDVKDRVISATTAKRAIVKLSKISDAEDVQEYWDNDPILRNALARALGQVTSGKNKTGD